MLALSQAPIPHIKRVCAPEASSVCDDCAVGSTPSAAPDPGTHAVHGAWCFARAPWVCAPRGSRYAGGVILRQATRGVVISALVIGALACDDDGAPSRDASVDAGAPPVDAAVADPVFPADFAARWREMRDCRFSHEHELRNIRVLASPDAEASYAALSPDAPYPVGATLLKIEYDDDQCAVPIEYTAMRKLAPGENPAGGDWRWQRVRVDRQVIENGAPWRCINCHTVHCAPPMGYDLTCAEEL